MATKAELQAQVAELRGEIEMLKAAHAAHICQQWPALPIQASVCAGAAAPPVTVLFPAVAPGPEVRYFAGDIGAAAGCNPAAAMVTFVPSGR